MKPTRILILLSMVLLLFVLVPIAAAERPCVVTGAGTGEGLSSSTVEVRVHFNSNAGGEVWVHIWSPVIPERNGTFRASIDTDGYQASETGLLSVATVRSSDNPTFPVGRQFIFFVARVDDEVFYVLTGDFLPWFLDQGNFKFRI